MAEWLHVPACACMCNPVPELGAGVVSSIFTGYGAFFLFSCFVIYNAEMHRTGDAKHDINITGLLIIMQCYVFA